MASKTLLLLIAFSLFPAFAEAQVTYGGNVQQEISVSSEAGESTATLLVTQVQTMLPGGRVADGSIIALFVPSSQLFWWMHKSSFGAPEPEKALKEFLDSITCAAYSDQIACFVAEGRTLEVRTSEMRVSSMDEGISKLHNLLPGELAKFRSGAPYEFQRVPIAKAVGEAFLTSKDSAFLAQLKVGAIDRSDSGWRIEIRNDRGESKTVALSIDFKTATSVSSSPAM
jgi:hypothetical protein